MEALHTEIFDCRDGQYGAELPDNHPPYVTHWGRWRDGRMPYKEVRPNIKSSRSHMVARLRQIYPHLPIAGTKPPPSERYYYVGYKVRSYSVFLGENHTELPTNWPNAHNLWAGRRKWWAFHSDEYRRLVALAHGREIV